MLAREELGKARILLKLRSDVEAGEAVDTDKIQRVPVKLGAS